MSDFLIDMNLNNEPNSLKLLAILPRCLLATIVKQIVSLFYHFHAGQVNTPIDKSKLKQTTQNIMKQTAQNIMVGRKSTGWVNTPIDKSKLEYNA